MSLQRPREQTVLRDRSSNCSRYTWKRREALRLGRFAVNADGSLRRLLRESIRKPNEFAGILQARNLALSLGERFADIKFLIRGRGSNFTAS
jgi:hypothetical protein